MENKSRIYQFDLLKTVAIILVMLQHCTTMLFKGNGMQGTDICSALWIGVPLFVMVSGAFQLQSTRYTPLQYYKKRYGRILPAFIFWSIIVYALSAATGKYEDITCLRQAMAQYIPYLLTGKINTAFWFVYMIAGLFLITPLLQYAFAKCGRRLVGACLIVWAGLTIAGDIIPGSTFMQRIHLIGIWPGYYILGFWVRKYLPDKKFIPLAAALCFIICLALNLGARAQGCQYASLDILEASSLFIAISKSGCRHECKAVTNTGRWSYAIYLSHFMLIGLIYAALPQISALGVIAPLATLAAVATAEYFMCKIVEKLRFIPGNLVGISG